MPAGDRVQVPRHFVTFLDTVDGQGKREVGLIPLRSLLDWAVHFVCAGDIFVSCSLGLHDERGHV